MTIRLTVPSIDQSDLDAVAAVLATGHLVQGQHVARFEQVVADYVGVPHAIAVSSGTAALHVALLAMDVKPGDRVAVAAYSWPATANAVVLCGAEPVFVDVDPATGNMRPDALDAVLATGGIRVVLPVHAFGGMADMIALGAVAARHDAVLLEDAACALGAAQAGRLAGAWGTAACFSFHPRKAITTGEGGMILTSDDELARRTRALRNHGLEPAAARPTFVMAGLNYRLTEFQAALGTSQMTKLERIVDARRAGAARYDALLEGSDVTAPVAIDDSRHVYQSYVVLLPENAASDRDRIIERMRAEQVEVSIGTHHQPLIDYYRQRQGNSPGDFPGTDEVARRALTLPLYEGITREDQERVVHALEQSVGAAAAGR